MTKLLAIVGQTASGKSSLAMRVAKQFDGEIIAADSRTVYKGLDIGTAKPTVDDMQQVRHHTIDVVDYGQSFTVADFKRLAHQAIFDIQERGKLPMLVGGSGLYLNSVLYDYELGGPADEGMRRELSGLTVHELQRRIVQTGIEMPENSP
ncbi:MAG: isopentenyl transferase family protein [Patescibacteria group bacterium]